MSKKPISNKPMSQPQPNSHPRRHHHVLAAFLAGGRSRRMGQADKFFLPLAGKTLLQHTIDRISPQVGAEVIVANGDLQRFASYRLPVLPDTPEVPEFAGPLAGIVTAMAWAKTLSPPLKWVASIPTDSPNLPSDLIDRLLQPTSHTLLDVVFPYSQGRSHYACALWALDAHSQLLMHLQRGEQALHRVISALRHQKVPFSDAEAFANINTVEDWQRCQHLKDPFSH